MEESSQIDLQKQLKDAGNNLLMFPPSTQNLLDILDQVEELLLKVDQAPDRPMQDALYPSMKALISDQLLRHSDMNVKVSVASCMSELTRITAPDPPYNDEQMKEIFQLAVIALGKLSCETCRCYAKAIRILDNVAKYRSCLLMLDLECDSLIVDIFQQLLRTIGFNHPHVVFSQMEYIMTLTIEESDEISHELLSTLLSSVRNENQHVSPLSWKLGERVLKNCAVKLKPFLMKEVKSMGLAFDNYSDVVAFVCQDFPGKECETTEKAGPSSGGPLKEAKDNETTKWRNDGTLRNIKALNTLERCHNGMQQENTDARRNSKHGCSDVIVISQADTDSAIQKKRGRKPNSAKKLQDGYNNSRSTEGRKYFKEPFCVKDYEKKVGSSAKSPNTRQLDSREEKETNSCDASSKASDLETVSVSAAQSVSYTNGSQPTRNRGKKNAIVKSQELGKKESTRRSRGKELTANPHVETTLTSSKVVLKKEEYFPEEYFGKDSRVCGDEVVGRNIKVWWPLDKKFYEGAISSFDPVTKTHQVLYADGDEEKLDLRNERWELLDNVSQSSDIEKHVDLPSTDTLSDEPPKKKAKTKSESPMKQANPVSSSRRRGSFAAKAKTQTLKSGGSADDSTPKAVCISGVAKDDTIEVNQSIKDAEQKSISEAYDLTRQPPFVVENENITYINDGVPKSTGKQETETLRTELAVGRASPHAIDAEIQNSAPEECRRDVEKTQLPDSVNVQEKETNSVKRRPRLIRGN